MANQTEKNEFSEMILLRADEIDATCLDTICDYCEQNSLEPEVAAMLINDVLKARLYIEAMRYRYIERSSTLPI